MEFLIETKCEIQKNFLTAMLAQYVSQLGLKNCRKFVTIMVDDDLGDSAGGMIPIYVPEENLDGYLIALEDADLNTLGLSLAHEMCHVRQQAKGYWRLLGEGYHIWCGKVVGPETHYLNLPWEIDAFRRQELLHRRALCDLGL